MYLYIISVKCELRSKELWNSAETSAYYCLGSAYLLCQLY